MNAIEAGKLLAFAALYDNRIASDPDVMAWLKAIGDLPYDDSETAIAGHYGETTERIMPGHVRTRVKAIRADRVARSIPPAPPAELTDEPGRYQRIVQANIARIADGMDVRKALGGGRPLEGEPPAEWQRAREALKGPDGPVRDLQQIAREQVEELRRAREEGGESA